LALHLQERPVPTVEHRRILHKAPRLILLRTDKAGMNKAFLVNRHYRGLPRFILQLQTSISRSFHPL
jgi:hypothetical protein